jgi:hypothetical protein
MLHEKPAHDDLPSTFRSEAFYSRALGLIPAATQTLAKGPGQFVRGVAPEAIRAQLRDGITFGGEALSLAAARATIEAIRAKGGRP